MRKREISKRAKSTAGPSGSPNGGFAVMAQSLTSPKRPDSLGIWKKSKNGKDEELAIYAIIESDQFATRI